MLARVGTPRAIVDRLNREARTAINSAEVNSKRVAAGVDPDPITLEALGAKMRMETERCGKVVKAARLKVQ